MGKDSIVGYYEKDGKLYKGYIKKAGEVEGIPIYITKERDRGFGREGEMNESSSYFVVLPMVSLWIPEHLVNQMRKHLML